MLTTEELNEVKQYVWGQVSQSLWQDQQFARVLEETVSRVPVRHPIDGRLDRIGAELAGLTNVVGQLAESHRRAEARLERLETTVADLASGIASATEVTWKQRRDGGKRTLAEGKQCRDQRKQRHSRNGQGRMCSKQ